MNDDNWPPPWWPHTETARWLLLVLALGLFMWALVYALASP